MRRAIRLLPLFIVVFFAGTALTRADEPAAARELPLAAEKKVDFVRDIQPLLRSRCYSCHGAEEQESGLRLDLKQRAFEGGDGGRVILPKKGAQSRLLRIVAGLDEDAGIMPPEGEGTPLTLKEVALFRAWIDQGAIWPDSADAGKLASDHWSFQPIQRPTPPTVKNMIWVRNPIDSFTAARHDKEGVKPSPEADRTTLIRRVHLDVLGLPPQPEQVQRYLSDQSDDAYERMVDEALKSKHYGERWGRHWLDLARYADSDGYEKDRPRPHAWRYRHWVINALNDDMPFDQFTIEQIAGDMLPDATIEQRVASGFHRNTLHNTEGGTDKEEDRVKKTVDRTNTVSAIWLGLTMGCAQCHSHKYDPISQREYYSTYAFFNDINETDVDAPLPAEAVAFSKAQVAFEAEHAKFLAAVAHYKNKKLPAARAAWEPTALALKSIWEPLELAELKSAKGATFAKQDDGSILVSGKNELSDVYTLKATVDASAITAIRLEVLPDKSLVANGPGRADNGNFVLATFGLSVAPRAGGDAKPVPFMASMADYSQSQWEVAKAINTNPQDGWAVGAQFGKRHVAAFKTHEPVGYDGGTQLTIVLDQTYKGPNAHNLGRFRLSITTSKGGVDLDGSPQAVAAALAVAEPSRTKEQQSAIATYYASIDPELAKLNAQVAEHAKKAPKPSGNKAQAVAQTGKRQASVHIRGDFLNPGDPVETKTLAALPALTVRGEKPDRLDFAHWLVADDNPLTARVTVNRLWQRYFGRGLVATSDDFGNQGEPPSHPLLLDWLASELQREGWSLKHIHKLIVMSATYRQGSQAREDLADIDPRNELLARQTRQRVEAEIIRDMALAVSGLLSEKIGGPSVRPPQPAEYSSLTYANSAKWAESKGADRYRRGLYTFFQRTSPYPMLITFDAPDSNSCTAQRSLSNTPLQALTVWNDRVFWECAQHLGRRIVRDRPASGKDAVRNRADYAFQLCLCRRPEPDELNAVVRLFEEQTKLCSADEQRTTQLVGKADQPPGVTPVELAGWTAVGRVLINLDEFITRE